MHEPYAKAIRFAMENGQALIDLAGNVVEAKETTASDAMPVMVCPAHLAGGAYCAGEVSFYAHHMILFGEPNGLVGLAFDGEQLTIAALREA